MRIGKIFGMQELGDLALGILIVAMTVGISLVAMDKFYSSLTTAFVGARENETSIASNATKSLITEVGNLPGWVGIIVIVAVAGIIFYYLRALRSGTR